MSCLPVPAQHNLVQIRTCYSTVWNHLLLSVESGANRWTASVSDPAGGKNLYTAHRPSANAAKGAALEFAAFQVLGSFQQRPEESARLLSWRESW